jgi:xanthine dehydrogenase accessory factor
MAAGQIPVLVDPQANCRHDLQLNVMVDAIMAKQNTGTTITDAPLVIALGPGFTAGVDCHAVVETQRGHWLGRVIWNGSALPDTGMPGEIDGQQARRVLRAPADGIFEAEANIGDQVKAGQVVARAGANEICAGCDGVVRGLIRSGRRVTAQIKVGDIDPRAEIKHCFTFSDKSLAVGGGVLEAILAGLERGRGSERVQADT